MGCRLSWSPGGDDLRIAVLAHRAAAQGQALWVSGDGYGGPATLAAAAQRFGIGTAHIGAEDRNAAPRPGPGWRVVPPRIVLYRGAAIGYPYYAYYAHCLWSLGLAYRGADAAAIAGGALDEADLLIIPGGFATWGLDRAEGLAGVDDAVRGFMARGGACIGSCGGAFYLSQGRPGWLGLVDAKPRYTQEYLSTGAGVLNVHLQDAALRGGLPETMELAYYHGPVYEQAERAAPTLGVFDSHIMQTRLFIDNPLEAARFDSVMRGRAAILGSGPPSDGMQGKAIAFSPHPEMGEFLRKGMALDGYIRHFLPIRGTKVMEETLRFYAREDCLSFRLVLNAALKLGAFDGPVPAVPAQAGAATGALGGSRAAAPVRVGGAAADAARANSAGGANGTNGTNGTNGALSAALARADTAWRAAVDALKTRAVTEEPQLAALIVGEIERLQGQWDELPGPADAAAALDPAFASELAPTLDDACAALANPAFKPIEALVMIELPLRLRAACARVARCDAIIKETM
jgi:hypothetical protein